MKMFSMQLALAFLLMAVGSVIAQDRKLGSSEFEELRDAVVKKSESLIRRETVISKTYDEGKLFESETIVKDILPPDRERWVTESLVDGKIVSTETIYIGEIEYRRENSGKWKKLAEGEGRTVIIAELISTPREEDKFEEVIEFSLKKTIIDNLEFTIIQSRSNSAFGLPGLYLRIFTVDNHGRIIKEEEQLKEGDGSRNSSSTITTTVYDLKDIKIEPPIK